MVRRTKEEALATRAQILDAAEQVFHARGVARTTLAEIATAAGVTRGAIYWHFSNKVDLFHAMLERVRLPLQELARASESDDEPDPLGRLRELLVTLMRQVALDDKVRRINDILFHKCEFNDELCDLRQQAQQASHECDLRLELSLRNAVNKGQLPATLDTNHAAICVRACVDGMLAHWLLVPESFALDQQAARMVDAMLDMLRLSSHLRHTCQ
jgi:TetR/AcrR family acrAB operon transcriptional repressor